MKVRFTLSARAQFLAGLEYIKADNPLAALALLARAKIKPAKVDHLSAVGAEDPRVP